MGSLYCLAGIPGTGKSTFAEKLLQSDPNLVYFNPDKYYERINGDECDRRNTFEVWHTMFGEIHQAAIEGKSVLIDSDNITFAQRIQWIEWFPEFTAHHLLFLERPFELCVKRVNSRRRKIPIDIMKKKAGLWENPIDHGDVQFWDSIVSV